MIDNHGIHDGDSIKVLGEIGPHVRYILDTFNQDKIILENPLISHMQLTGYPFLIHIIDTILLNDLRGKKILEIGGGTYYGRKILDSLTSKGALSFGMDKRHGDPAPPSGGQWGGLWRYDWSDLKKSTPEIWDCIFNHRIGPNDGGYEAVTDRALKPGGYYLSFRQDRSESSEPVERKYFLDRGYTDFSFHFQFSGQHRMEDRGYQVTLLQKPLQTDSVIAATRDDIDAKL